MKIICVALLLSLLLPITANAQPNVNDTGNLEEQMKSSIQNRLDELDLKDMDRFIRDIQTLENPIFTEATARDFVSKLLTGNIDFDMGKLWSYIINILFKEIAANLGLMAKIIVLAVLSGILKNMQDSFQNSSTAEIAHFVCYMVVMLLIMRSVSYAMGIGQRAIDNMLSFTQILMPVLLVLLVSIGGVTSSAILNPTIGLLVGLIGTVLRNVILFLILCATAITLVNHISDRVQLKRLGILMKNMCGWILGIVFTVFVGALIVQGALAASIDGISIRTAKFAVDTFVPIVGGLFAQAVDMVVGCSMLIKNAVGFMGLLVVAFICLYPLIKIFCIMIIYKFTSAMLESVADSRIADCLDDIGNILIILSITVAGMAMMFFLIIALIIGVGNVTTMMR
ncbi:MAG: stage III sporulation protein AE [Clostridiales bacterium]|nr:stage III sporulation protein AE [Clostridiales bacterium]